ncbi:MAG: helix-turn-helix domain-containing protein [Turicibacter sp.]
MNDKKTIELDTILNVIESEEELSLYLNQTLPEETLSFINYIDSIRSSKDIKKSVLIEQSDIHRTYGYQILNGTKSPSRDNILKLCIGGCFTVEETNKALTLSGYNKLYAKDKRDSLLIFTLNKQFNLIDTNLFLDRYHHEPLGTVE